MNNKKLKLIKYLEFTNGLFLDHFEEDDLVEAMSVDCSGLKVWSLDHHVTGNHLDGMNNP